MSDKFLDDLSRGTGPWVVQWCCFGPQKGTWHVDTLKDAIRSNLRVFAGANKAEYVAPWIILGVVATIGEASELAEQLRELRKQERLDQYVDE